MPWNVHVGDVAIVCGDSQIEQVSENHTCPRCVGLLLLGLELLHHYDVLADVSALLDRLHECVDECIEILSAFFPQLLRHRTVDRVVGGV